MSNDLREIKSHNVYVKFISSLDESQQEAMTAWLKEGKEGFYYRTAEHKQGAGIESQQFRTRRALYFSGCRNSNSSTGVVTFSATPSAKSYAG